MRARPPSSSISRLSTLHNTNAQAPFLQVLKGAFRDDDVENAAKVLAMATDSDWTDLGDWACRLPDMDDKVRFLLEACKCMPYHQHKAAEALINIMDKLQQAPADAEQGPAALGHMLHASAHARWVDLLAARPGLLERYCALLGKGPDAARAFCFLAKHMASKEDTSPHAWEVWNRSVEALDDATRLQITTHIRAIDRPVFTWQKNRNYRALSPVLFDKSGLKTRVPLYIFVFPGDVNEQMQGRALALRAFLHNAGRVLGRPAKLEEFEGIRCVQTWEGRPAIEVHYSSYVAETVRYYMGFASSDNNWPSEFNYQSIHNKVSTEFAELWADVKPSSAIPEKNELSWCEDASREQFASIIQRLSPYNLLIGESHSHFAALNFIVQNMRGLHDSGYTTLYLENMPAEAQHLANDFLYGNKPMAPELQLVHKREFLTILKLAKEVGMRVVFADTDLIRLLPHKYGAGMDPRRLAAFNEFARRVINHDAELRGGGKFVMLLGGAHLWNQLSASSKSNVWGIQHALPNCRSLFMFDLPAPDGEDPNPEQAFVIFTHDQKYKLALDGHAALSGVVADVYIGAPQPIQMSATNSASDGITERGVLPFEMPPKFSSI